MLVTISVKKNSDKGTEIEDKIKKGGTPIYRLIAMLGLNLTILKECNCAEMSLYSSAFLFGFVLSCLWTASPSLISKVISGQRQI